MKKLLCAAAEEQHSLPMPTLSLLLATLHAVCSVLSRHVLPRPGYSSTLCVLLHVSAEPSPWPCSWRCPLLPRAWMLCLAWRNSCQTVLSSLLCLPHSLTVLIAFSNARLSSFSNFSCIIFVIDPIKFLSFSMSSPALKAKSFVVSCSWITYALIAFVGPRFRSYMAFSFVQNISLWKIFSTSSNSLLGFLLLASLSLLLSPQSLLMLLAVCTTHITKLTVLKLQKSCLCQALQRLTFSWPSFCTAFCSRHTRAYFLC